jgi:hypothetical protein
MSSDVNRQVPPAAPPGRQVSVDDIALFVKNLCLTYSQLSIYPADHPISQRQMENAWTELQPAFRNFGDLSISLAEGKLLFSGMPVEERNPAVAKFAKHFESLLIHSIRFRKSCTKDEFEMFFTVFCQDPKAIVEAGGIQQALEKNGIRNIEFNTSVYRMINEDEKIVKKSESYAGAVESKLGNEDVIKYFVEKMFALSKDQREFVTEMKNNPEQLAKQIVDFIEHVGVGAGFDSSSMIESMLRNIELVAEHISASGGETPDEKTNIAESMMELERQLKKKSKGLASKDSIRFLKRITDIVSTYTEKTKAEKIIGQFLDNQKSLAAAEKMMKELSTDSGSSSKILDSINMIMKEKGLNEDQLVEHLKKASAGGAAGPRKARRPRSQTPQSVDDKLKDTIEHDFPEVKNKEKLLHYIENIFNSEVNSIVEARTRELEEQTEVAKKLLGSLHEIFEHTNIGIIVMDEDENVSFSENGSYFHEGLQTGEKLPEDMRKKLLSFANPGEMTVGKSLVWQVEKNADGTKIRSVLFQFG